MAPVTAAGPAIRRERAPELGVDRLASRASEVEEPLAPIGPARGVALAIGLGALAWLFLIAVLLRF